MKLSIPEFVAIGVHSIELVNRIVLEMKNLLNDEQNVRFLRSSAQSSPMHLNEDSIDLIDEY